MPPFYERAGGQVAVPEQGVAPPEVDEVTGPRLTGRRDTRHPGIRVRRRRRTPAGGRDARDGRGRVAPRGRVAHLSRLTTRSVTSGEAEGWVGGRAGGAHNWWSLRWRQA